VGLVPNECVVATSHVDSLNISKTILKFATAPAQFTVLSVHIITSNTDSAKEGTVSLAQAGLLGTLCSPDAVSPTTLQLGGSCWPSLQVAHLS
jgi:hypothetical protein